MRRVALALAEMTGSRERCMYCEDSRGTDVEHFRPKALYKDLIFQWLNLLWICTACNRSKGRQFPCDSSGGPLLIDPTAEDPWDFLFFDPESGEITARWDTSTKLESPKGRTLLEVLTPLRHQAVTEGRRRAFRNIRRAVRAFLAQEEGHVVADISEETIKDLLECVDDATEYGLAIWFFLRDGQDEEPFRRLRDEFPATWRRIVEKLTIPR